MEPPCFSQIFTENFLCFRHRARYYVLSIKSKYIDMALDSLENLKLLSIKTLANRTKQNIYSIIHPNRVGYMQVMQRWSNNSLSKNIINHNNNRSNNRSKDDHLIIFVQWPKIHLIDFNIQ